VGPGTQRALRVPVEQRIDQIRVDLERARWVIRHLGERHILVNVSSAQVYLLNDRRVEWSARCQVGQAARQTPIFRADMRYLVFNPDWTVPRGILARDILPAGKRGEAVLQRKNLDAFDRNGNRVDPSRIQWSRYTASSFPYTLRQKPGPTNALGQVKFMFPNEHAVYLHDTPSRDLFLKDVRTFSSGCIRVDRPLELAERLLDDRSKWSAEKMRQVVASGRTTNVTLARPIPVLLLYFTVTIDREGLLRFSDDVYQRDAKVLRALDEPPQLRRRPLSGSAR
jgi:murein L,D-transpeptidase YcbB/YkuD